MKPIPQKTELGDCYKELKGCTCESNQVKVIFLQSKSNDTRKKGFDKFHEESWKSVRLFIKIKRLI